MVALPLLLRVIHASSKAVSRITRVSGSKDPLPIPSMFPPYNRGCQEQDLLEPPQKVVGFLELTGTSGDYSKSRLAQMAIAEPSSHGPLCLCKAPRQKGRQ